MANSNSSSSSNPGEEEAPAASIKPIAGNVGLIPLPLSEDDREYYRNLLGVSLTSSSGSGSGSGASFSKNLVTNGDIAGFLNELGSQSHHYQTGSHFETESGTGSGSPGTPITKAKEKEEEQAHADEEDEEGK